MSSNTKESIYVKLIDIMREYDIFVSSSKNKILRDVADLFSLEAKDDETFILSHVMYHDYILISIVLNNSDVSTIYSIDLGRNLVDNHISIEGYRFVGKILTALTTAISRDINSFNKNNLGDKTYWVRINGDDNNTISNTNLILLSMDNLTLHLHDRKVFDISNLYGRTVGLNLILGYDRNDIYRIGRAEISYLALSNDRKPFLALDNSTAHDVLDRTERKFNSDKKANSFHIWLELKAHYLDKEETQLGYYLASDVYLAPKELMFKK